MTQTDSWQKERLVAMKQTIAELSYIGSRYIIPHGEAMQLWRIERDAAIRAARARWTTAELSDRRIAELVGCTPKRVWQITDGA